MRLKMIEQNLKDLPTADDLQRIKKIYPEVNVKAIIGTLQFMAVAKKLTKAYASFFDQFGLTEAKFTVLMLLFRIPQHTLSPSEIAAKSGITRSSATTLIDGLLTKQLISRQYNKKDRRKMLIKLAPKGEKILSKILPTHYAQTSALLSEFSSVDQRQLLNLLNKIDDGISNFEKETAKLNLEGK